MEARIPTGRGRPGAGFARAEGGGALAEFALTAPVVIFMLVAILELGMYLFVEALLEASVREAARYGITGQEAGAAAREARIEAILGERTLGLLDIDVDSVAIKVYDSFASIAEDEPFTDTNGNGTRDGGEPFQDRNGNGTWDADPGVPGVGGPRDIVVYRVTAEWHTFTPFLAHVFGDNGTMRLKASVPVLNEPFNEGL